jgi:hypothetical protein
MSARNTVVRTTCSNPTPAARRSAPRFHHLLGLRGDITVDERTARRIERDLTDTKSRVAGLDRRRVRTHSLGCVRALMTCLIA